MYQITWSHKLPLAIIALSVVQSFARILIHNVILFIKTSTMPVADPGFPRERAPTPTYYLTNLTENVMKMKKFWPRAMNAEYIKSHWLTGRSCLAVIASTVM